MSRYAVTCGILGGLLAGASIGAVTMRVVEDHRPTAPLRQEGVVIEAPDGSRSTCDVTWGDPVLFENCEARP